MAIALLLAAVLLGYYNAVLKPDQNEYMTIYLLDTQKKATNYPELLIKGENNTFSVYVMVENHMEDPKDCQIRVKVTSNRNTQFPVLGDPTHIFSGTVRSGAIWENLATLALNDTGDYWVVFELWIANKMGDLEFTENFCVLNLQVVENTVPS